MKGIWARMSSEARQSRTLLSAGVVVNNATKGRRPHDSPRFQSVALNALAFSIRLLPPWGRVPRGRQRKRWGAGWTKKRTIGSPMSDQTKKHLPIQVAPLVRGCHHLWEEGHRAWRRWVVLLFPRFRPLCGCRHWALSDQRRGRVEVSVPMVGNDQKKGQSVPGVPAKA